MSDSDEYEINDSDEEYDFEYSDDGGSSQNSEVDAENAYYNAKGMKEEGLEEAAKAFLKVVEEEAKEGGAKTQWGFKSLKQLIKVRTLQSSPTLMIQHYRTLLTYISSGSVTQNVSEKAINGILDRLSQSGDVSLLHEVYKETLSIFSVEGTANPRLWTKCSLKLGQLLLDTDDIPRLRTVIDSLLAHDSESMEVYALQIQMYGRLREVGRLKSVWEKATSVQNNVPHPRTLAIIHECGGKTWMAEERYEEASTAFFVAFKGFDEAGDSARLRVLKYLLLASMLHASDINPLDSPECRPYKDSPGIAAMT